jgi:hypothetical protein
MIGSTRVSLLPDTRLRQLLWVAVTLWLASWFLPVIDDVAGWQAFRAALSSFWPYGSAASNEFEDAVPHVLSAATNVAFVILALHIQLGRAMRAGIFLRIAIACVLLNLYWLVQAARAGQWHALLAGYYSWLAAFVLLVVIGVSIHRTSRTPTAGTPA